MGLDMGGWPHASASEREAFAGVLALVGAEADGGSPSLEVRVKVGYWRKANHVHRWFVEHCCGGEDQCRPHEVTREHLQQLREVCRRVLAHSPLVPGRVANGYSIRGDGAREYHYEDGLVIGGGGPLLAEQLLPVQAGFFFGSTEYHEYYLADVGDTVKIIDRCLALPDNWSFEYRASW